MKSKKYYDVIIKTFDALLELPEEELKKRLASLEKSDITDILIESGASCDHPNYTLEGPGVKICTKCGVYL